MAQRDVDRALFRNGGDPFTAPTGEPSPRWGSRALCTLAFLTCFLLGAASAHAADDGPQVCSGFDAVDAQAIAATSTPGSIFTFFGSASEEELFAFAYVIPKVPNPDVTVTVLLQMLKESDADPLLASSWRNERWGTATLAESSHVMFEDLSIDEDNVPKGGLGRYRMFLIWFDPCELKSHVKSVKPYLTQEAPGVVADGLTLHSGFIADGDPTPSQVSLPDNAPPRLELRNYLGQARKKFNPRIDNPRFDPASREFESNLTTLGYYQEETRAYYDAVKTGADGSGPSISEALGTLQAFRNRYFSRGKELVSEYYNKGDLGIGREMHCNFELPGERACYVSNFAPCLEPLEANGRCSFPEFDKRAESFESQRRGDVPFATVAMVERDSIDPNEKNSVFFAVYVCTGRDCNQLSDHELFTGPVALDNHGVAAVRKLQAGSFSGGGSNVFNPGNCLTCHGAGGSYDPETHSTTGAYFLPFDMNAFEYLDGYRNGPLSRVAQHDIMREMNAKIAESHLGGVGTARSMIEAWYDGDFRAGQFSAARMPEQGGFVRGEASGSIYSRVYAKACRGCHISHPNLQLSSLSQWEVFAALIEKKVCEDRDMPLAERTQDILWKDNVRQPLLRMLLPGSRADCRSSDQD